MAPVRRCADHTTLWRAFAVVAGAVAVPGGDTGGDLGVFPSRRASTPALLAVCLLFGGLGWVSVQHFVTSGDVRRAL